MKLSQNSRQQWWFWPKFLPSGFLRSQMKPTKQNQKWHWRGQMTDQHEFPIDVLKPCTATGIPINTSQCYIPAYAKKCSHTHQPTIHQCSHSDCNPKILQSPTLSLTAWLRLWATTPMSLVLSIALSTFCRVILMPKWGLLMALTANDFVANIGKPRPPIFTWRWYARASCFTHFSIHWALTVSPISKILDNPVVVRAWSSKTRTEANWTQ